MDKPGILFRPTAHDALEVPERLASAARITQTLIDGIDTGDGTVHGEHDARRKHGVDERIGVAKQQVIDAAGAVADVRIVASGRYVGDQLGVLQTLGKRRAQADRREEKFAYRYRACLGVVGPYHRTNARRAVGKRNEPEPPVVEPVDRDIARTLVRIAACTAKMTIQCRATVFGVAPLGL